MSLYLDANLIIGILTDDPLTLRANALLRQNPEPLLISDIGALEFTAVVSRRVRVGAITREHGRAALAIFDQWSIRNTRRVEIDPLDVAVADAYLRRFDLMLLAPDALHIAIAQRLGAKLASFDQRMVAAAEILGVPVAEG